MKQFSDAATPHSDNVVRRDPSQEELIAHLRHLRKQRAVRAAFFDSALFGEPAWDLLLDLYAAALEDRRTSVSSACIATGAPATTALRWIKLVESRELIHRTPDHNDGRRIFIALTPAAREAMRQYLTALT